MYGIAGYVTTKKNVSRKKGDAHKERSAYAREERTDNKAGKALAKAKRRGE